MAEPDTNPIVASDVINNQNHDEQVSAEQPTTTGPNTDLIIVSDAIKNQNHDEKVSAEQQTLSALIESEGAKRSASVSTQDIDAMRSSSAPPMSDQALPNVLFALESGEGTNLFIKMIDTDAMRSYRLGDLLAPHGLMMGVRRRVNNANSPALPSEVYFLDLSNDFLTVSWANQCQPIDEKHIKRVPLADVISTCSGRDKDSPVERLASMQDFLLHIGDEFVKHASDSPSVEQNISEEEEEEVDGEEEDYANTIANQRGRSTRILILASKKAEEERQLEEQRAKEQEDRNKAAAALKKANKQAEDKAKRKLQIEAKKAEDNAKKEIAKAQRQQKAKMTAQTKIPKKKNNTSTKRKLSKKKEEVETEVEEEEVEEEEEEEEDEDDDDDEQQYHQQKKKSAEKKRARRRLSTLVGSSDTVKYTVPPKHEELNPTSAASVSSSVVPPAPSPSPSATSAMGNPALHQQLVWLQQQQQLQINGLANGVLPTPAAVAPSYAGHIMAYNNSNGLAAPTWMTMQQPHQQQMMSAAIQCAGLPWGINIPTNNSTNNFNVNTYMAYAAQERAVKQRHSQQLKLMATASIFTSDDPPMPGFLPPGLG